MTPLMFQAFGTPEELALEALESHVAAGRMVILATLYPQPEGSVIPSFLWPFGVDGHVARIHRPARIVGEVEAAKASASYRATGYVSGTGPGDYRFYVVVIP